MKGKEIELNGKCLIIEDVFSYHRIKEKHIDFIVENNFHSHTLNELKNFVIIYCYNDGGVLILYLTERYKIVKSRDRKRKIKMVLDI